jgi:aryl-alcohol dehydrogenase-like predicted oxidoreductase
MTTRRDVLRFAGASVALAGCGRNRASATDGRIERDVAGADSSPGAAAAAVPRRPLGQTGASVSILGLGGSHLGGMKDDAEAIRVVHAAIDAGINFFDNAWEYHDGRSEEILGRALAGKRDQVFLMTKVCTHGRGADVALAQLEDSLRRLGTDHLDLWQVHECVYDNDPERHYAAGGVLDALARAKEQGKVRFVGFTGHKDPKIHLEMLERGFAFDTAQMPLNAFDAGFRSFEQQVVPELVRRRMGVIGMKSLGGQGLPVLQGAVAPEEAIRYAMSIPGVSVTVSGVDSMEVLTQNLALARGFTPMPEAERRALRARLADAAADGHFELYKTTTYFDGKVGREQHGYPPHESLPL